MSNLIVALGAIAAIYWTCTVASLSRTRRRRLANLRAHKLKHRLEREATTAHCGH